MAQTGEHFVVFYLIIKEQQQEEHLIQNKHLGNGDYYVIIASSSHPLFLTEHAANGLVEAPLKWTQRMKDLLLCVHVVVKTLNLEISRRHLADYVKELN